VIYIDKELSQKTERTEARSNADFVETRARIDPSAGACWIEVGGAYAMFDGIGSPLTQTFGLGIFEDATTNHLDKIESFFTERGAGVFHEVSPLADQSILSLLGERGYMPIELTSVMIRPIGLTHATNSEIKTRIVGEDEADLWAETAAAGWATEHESLADFMLAFGKIAARTSHGFPFLAEIDGEPVAAGGLNIFGDICLLAGASTKPEARNRGAQSKLLEARLAFAESRGCQLAMMCAAPGSQSQKNAQKNGFHIAYTRTKWQLMR
jgi:GNAT superfamily N-acetyltransferase